MKLRVIVTGDERGVDRINNFPLLLHHFDQFGENNCWQAPETLIFALHNLISFFKPRISKRFFILGQSVAVFLFSVILKFRLGFLSFSSNF